MDARPWFDLATAGFRRVVAGLDAAQLDDPALGEWDVRALLGHTCRAFLTIENYVAQADNTTDPVTLAGPADYYRATRAGLADPAQVTQRGRDAGAALGQDPVAAVAAILDRVPALVTRTRDDAPVATPVGRMRLIDYLPTRAFELSVHGIDLARATGQPVPEELMDTLGPCLALCTELAAPEQRLTMVLSLTGREPLPGGFTVL